MYWILYMYFFVLTYCQCNALFFDAAKLETIQLPPNT
jgi:hypothetical protein